MCQMSLSLKTVGFLCIKHTVSFPPSYDEPSNMPVSDKRSLSTWTKCLLLFVFSSFGFVKMINHDMVLVGVEDILAKTDYSSGWISAMLNIPYILTTIVLRVHFIHSRFQDSHRLWFASMAILLGSFGVGFLEVVPLRIASVFVTGVGIVSLQTAVMSLTAKYPDTVIHTYIIADACGRLFTPFIYTALTTYVCINPRLVFISTAITSAIFPLYNHLVLNKLSDYEPEGQTNLDREELHFNFKESERQIKSKGKRKAHDHNIIPWSTKITLLYTAFPQYYADFLGLGFQTLFTQSFFTTLVFPGSPFKPREHYQYYMLVMCGGLFLGRMYGFIRKWFFSDKEPCFGIGTESWIMVILGLCNLTALFIAIWYRIMPNVWVVVTLAFSTGLIAGISYVLCLTPVSKKESHVVFTRTATVVIHGIACLGAASAAIILEPLIRQRCFELTHTREYCIARYIGIGHKPCFSH